MHKTLLIARREYLAFVRTVGFWLSLFTLPLIICASVVIPMLLRHSEPPQTVAILDLSGDNLEPQLRGFLARHAPKPSGKGFMDGGGLVTVPLPPELTPAMTPRAAEAKIPQVLADGKAGSVIVATDDGQALHFRIWSSSGHKEDVNDAIMEDLHGLQYYKLARTNGIDPGLAKAMHDAKADIVTITPESAAAPKTDGFAEGFRENGPRFLGIFISYITWMSIFSSSMILLGSVIEEKSSKVLEVLLASASTGQILVGKVLGVACVLLTVAAMWAAVFFGVSRFGFGFLQPDQAQMVMAGLSAIFSPERVALLLAYFVGGYLMFGIFFAAIGAFCETQKDAQAVMGPTMIVLMIPMMMMQSAFTAPDLPMLRYMSWFPLFTPFLMPLRLVQNPPWWEIAGTLVLMGVVALAMINMGRRAFRHGALTGEKLSWGALLGMGRRDV
jgi:ABC-2 type transport system permease protein